MSRIAGSSGARTAKAIERAALELIHRHGFEGFGLRELAARVGLQPASLYNHIDSKQALLFGIIAGHMDELIRRTRDAMAGCDADPVDRLLAFTTHHLSYHLDKKLLVYVANFELRALTAANLAAVIAQRRDYEAILIGILDEGCAGGVIDVADTHIAAYAMLAMLTGACTWYKPEGRLGRAEMIRLHAQLLLKGCLRGGVAGPATAATGPTRCNLAGAERRAAD